MPVNTQAIGKKYQPVVYAVGREKIKEYSLAVGETNPLHLDVAAARAAGFADVVAPPMFAVVYSAPAVG
ncbi:MAG TPA: MaoC family dehydratase N-terminal domain-containing protein, partial [Solirubrobacteraceae bacterium]